MNRIFKTVWSRTKNMYVVVSEIANSCGKSKGGHVIDIKAAFAAVLILTSSVPFGVHAAEGSVHYLSVNSSEQGSGSNYKNDGAKAKDSIVLGVRSSSEGINGVVVGNDNKLTGIKNNQNNSVVMGTGLNVDGVHNIVVGTNYENYDQKETKVKGEHNTVIGSGNLVGYTAVKDSNDATKWIYTEVSTSGSDQNVVFGSRNTANLSSVAVGTDLEVEDLGRAFGSGNKIIGSNNGGGQLGLALGSNNTVKGEMAVSVGTGTNASGDYTVSIGSEAKTNETQSIAMGYKAETVKGWSAAIGSDAKTEGTASTAVGGLNVSATVDYGAAFGSFSVAQRARGVAGYLANGQSTMAWKSNLGAFSVGDDVKGYSRQITGVAAGTKDTDAVNVAQLKALENKIGTGGTNGVTVEKVEKITKEIKTEFKNEITKEMNEFKTESVRGDALGAALSALKPLDYDPYNRSQIMAGVSTYKGQEAIALGLAYYSNENTLLHAGLSYAGSSELMANAGISYRFGSSYDRKFLEERNKLMPQYKGGVISSVYVMQDEMTKLQKENEILKEKNAKAEAENKEMKSELEILKKQVSKLMEKI